MIRKDLATEVAVTEQSRCWREQDGLFYGATISDAGRTAIGIDEGPEPAIEQAEADAATITDPDAGTLGEQLTEAASAAEAQPRTKQALVIDMLREDTGASLAELVAETGWLPHTTRAALTGLRKKGHDIVSAKRDGVTRYRIEQAA